MPVTDTHRPPPKAAVYRWRVFRWLLLSAVGAVAVVTGSVAWRGPAGGGRVPTIDGPRWWHDLVAAWRDGGVCASLPGAPAAQAACRAWLRVCGQPWQDVVRRAARGNASCFGASAADGVHCVVPSLCVSRDHGAWVEEEALAPASVAALGGSLPAIMTLGLGPAISDQSITIPVRSTTRLLGAGVAVDRTAGGAPALVMSFYECAHLSHFMFNGVYPAFAAWLRLGARADTRLLLVGDHRHCRYLDVLDAFLGAPRAGAAASLLDLADAATLPTTPTCFGPVLVGSRGACLHAYCARAVGGAEHDQLRAAVLRHFNVTAAPPPVGGGRPLRVTVVQRAGSRAMTNLGDVAALLIKLRDAAAETCVASGGRVRRARVRDAAADDGAGAALDTGGGGAWPDVRAALAVEFNRTPAHARRAAWWCAGRGGPPFAVAVVSFERATVAEQMAVAASTDVLIAAHGNALGNAMYMRRGAAVVEVFMRDWWSPWFADPLTGVMGLRHAGVQCADDACLPGASSSPFEAELASFARSDPRREAMIKLRNVTVPLHTLLPAVVGALAAAHGACARCGAQAVDAVGGGLRQPPPPPPPERAAIAGWYADADPAADVCM